MLPAGKALPPPPLKPPPARPKTAPKSSGAQCLASLSLVYQREGLSCSALSVATQHAACQIDGAF